jgi:predicted ATPase
MAVAMGVPAEGGSRNVSRQQQETSGLHKARRLVKGYQAPRWSCWSYFLRAESVFNVISYIDSTDDTPPPPSLHERSHGAAFMDLLLGFSGDGFYLLDEPEAALSPNRQLAALSAIDQLVRRGAQFIIATHSPILLAYPNAKILLFDQDGMRETAYEDSEHVAVTRDFLNHYPRRLQQLLGDERNNEQDTE